MSETIFLLHHFQPYRFNPNLGWLPEGAEAGTCERTVVDIQEPSEVLLCGSTHYLLGVVRLPVSICVLHWVDPVPRARCLFPILLSHTWIAGGSGSEGTWPHHRTGRGWSHSVTPDALGPSPAMLHVHLGFSGQTSFWKTLVKTNIKRSLSTGSISNSDMLRDYLREGYSIPQLI